MSLLFQSAMKSKTACFEGALTIATVERALGASACRFFQLSLLLGELRLQEILYVFREFVGKPARITSGLVS
eukprot:8637227-Pyramimonas_sp.AAC.1